LGILTESTNPAVYWRVLKKRLRAEGNQTVTNCHGLKMTATDGKHCTQPRLGMKNRVYHEK